MEIESLTYLWIHTANRLSSVTFSLTSLTSTLGACLKMVVYPLYRPRKRGGPGQGGARMVIGQFGDSFPSVDGQGSCCQDVWPAPDVPH